VLEIACVFLVDRSGARLLQLRGDQVIEQFQLSPAYAAVRRAVTPG
jgi:hypothetical protein